MSADSDTKDTKRTNTPRTDSRAHELQADGLLDYGFCCQLERELSAEREKVRELREALTELHEFAFYVHGLNSSWVKPLNDASAIIAKHKEPK